MGNLLRFEREKTGPRANRKRGPAKVIQFSLPARPLCLEGFAVGLVQASTGRGLSTLELCFELPRGSSKRNYQMSYSSIETGHRRKTTGSSLIYSC
jgi:hypothetical protein